MNNPETVDAIKLMVLGSMIADYGARLLKDNTKQNLKYRVNCVIQAVKNLEMHFINHDNTNEDAREAFKRSFNKNETVLLADLCLTLWQVNEEGLETIRDAINNSLEPEQAITESTNQ